MTYPSNPENPNDLRVKVLELPKEVLIDSFPSGNYVIAKLNIDGNIVYQSTGEFKAFPMDESKFNARKAPQSETALDIIKRAHGLK
jgi:hypothetical protein